MLIESNITGAGKPLKDHYTAFQYIKEQARLKRKSSIDFIKEICALVMKNTDGYTKQFQAISTF